MRAILAYAPAIVLLGVAIAALVAVPPVTQYNLVRCETLGGAPPGICSSTVAYSVDYIEVALLAGMALAAVIYVLVVRRVRARRVTSGAVAPRLATSFAEGPLDES